MVERKVYNIVAKHTKEDDSLVQCSPTSSAFKTFFSRDAVYVGAIQIYSTATLERPQFASPIAESFRLQRHSTECTCGKKAIFGEPNGLNRS